MLKFFLHTLLLLILGSTQLFAQESTLPQHLKRDGRIRLYIYHTETFANLTYLDANGQWLPKAYDEINFLLRSYTDEKIHPIDKRLIELADHLQDHFSVDVIEVISGFRSPDYNRELKESGHNVANESFHTKGMAMDIHIDEINEKEVRDYLQSLKLGGVGYYGAKLMVHMDFGPVRTWEDDSFRENVNVGIFNKALPFHMNTQKFYYSKDEAVNVWFEKLVVNFDFKKIVLQKFTRGKFEILSEQPAFLNVPTGLALKTETVQSQGQQLYGKFRFHYENGEYWQNSNEFYVKRQP